MSLLLTKTCEYAILVSIQQGRYFSVNNNGSPYSIKIETELDLKLPPSIEDLIPTKTIIHSPLAKVDTNGNCSFNISLVYFVSFKQLQRLRRTDAKTKLRLLKVNNDGTTNITDNSLQFSVSEAKEVIPQSQHKLDQIYKFVLDKGAWCTIPKTRQQLKVGLFYVAMPDNAITTTSSSSMTSNNSVLNTPSIQLRSPPATPIMPKRITATNSNRKKKISSILGTPSTLFTSNSNGSGSSNSTTTTNSTTTSSLRLKKSSPSIREEKPKRVPLKRTKSSLVDLNIEELADVLKQIDIFSNEDNRPKPSLPPPYHQIGKGSSQYTFYLRIMYADHVNQLLLRQSTPISKKITHLKKPFFGYTFLTNYNLTPTASINQLDRHDGNKSCFQLRGHLYDIQNWLDAQDHIELNYILMDKYTKETVGKAKIPLQGIAFEGNRMMSDKVYPVYDSTDNETLIAKVTVRIGLVSGWRKEEEYDDSDLSLQQQKRKSIQSNSLLTAFNQQQQQQQEDPWDIIQNKKMRHLSQSSVPTLLTSSTTTSTTKSSTNHNVPSIQFIQQQRPTLKKSKYFKASSSCSSFIK